jgi:hypothetical protein
MTAAKGLIGDACVWLCRVKDCNLDRPILSALVYSRQIDAAGNEADVAEGLEVISQESCGSRINLLRQ